MSQVYAHILFPSRLTCARLPGHIEASSYFHKWQGINCKRVQILVRLHLGVITKIWDWSTAERLQSDLGDGLGLA